MTVAMFGVVLGRQHSKVWGLFGEMLGRQTNYGLREIYWNAMNKLTMEIRGVVVI